MRGKPGLKSDLGERCTSRREHCLGALQPPSADVAMRRHAHRARKCAAIAKALLLCKETIDLLARAWNRPASIVGRSIFTTLPRRTHCCSCSSWVATSSPSAVPGRLPDWTVAGLFFHRTAILCRFRAPGKRSTPAIGGHAWRAADRRRLQLFASQQGLAQNLAAYHL